MTRSLGLFLVLLFALLVVALPVASQEPVEESKRITTTEHGSVLLKQRLDRCRAANENANRPCRMLLFCERLTNSDNIDARAERICTHTKGFLRQMKHMRTCQLEGEVTQNTDRVSPESKCPRHLARLFNSYSSSFSDEAAERPSRHRLHERLNLPSEEGPAMERSGVDSRRSNGAAESLFVRIYARAHHSDYNLKSQSDE